MTVVTEYVTWRDIAERIPTKDDLQKVSDKVDSLATRLSREKSQRGTLVWAALANAVAILGLYSTLKH